VQAPDSPESCEAFWGVLFYKVDFGQFDEHAEEFAKLSLADQKRFLLEILDRNQLYVNLSEIDDTDYQVSEALVHQ
jgi:adenine-specific DNA-methyltransferase